jgi:hypothetical protein
MSLRPQRNIHKCLLSTTSRLVGEFETDDALLTHAWPDFHDRDAAFRWSEGPASRSAFIYSFQTEDEPIKSGPVPNYSPTGEIISGYLALLFGKRFDHHGLVEGSGYFHLPDLAEYGHLCRHRLPHNSHLPRADFAVPLNLVEFARFKPLLEGTSVSLKFERSLQTCTKFYLQALQTFERDPEVAYLNLITAIEVLSNFYKYKQEDLIEPETINALQQIETQLPNGEKIAKLFRGNLLKVKKRFLKTISNLVDDNFFAHSEASEAMFALKKETFDSRMRAAYDLRSRYVHTGVPFGSWISMSVGCENSEIQVGVPVIKEDPKLGELIGLAPTFVGLERVTRYVLLQAALQQGAYSAPESKSTLSELG